MNKTDQAVAAAKEYLIKNKRDIAHDWEHHKDVWKNCRQIIKHENLNVNTDLLKVSTFWHDVIVGKVKWPSKLSVEDTCKALTKLLPSLGFSNKETTKITETILHHEFRDTPTTFEGLILQDADKLDVLSDKRRERTLNDYKRGEMSKKSVQSYIRTALKWIPILSATFHFKYSRQIADKSVNELFSDKKIQQLVKDLELAYEYQKAKKDMGSIKTKLIRISIRLKNLLVKTKLLI